MGPASPYEDATIIFTHIPKAAGTTLERIFHAIALLKRVPMKRFYGSLYNMDSDKNATAYEKFENYSDKSLAKLKFISGHLPYGIHDRLEGNPLYITVLREPLSRCISHFRFRQGRGLLPKHSDFKELFDKGYLNDNLQVRQLSGERDYSKTCDEKMLQRAVDNLGHYGIVGLAESFHEVISSIVTLLKGPDIIYERYQVSGNKIDEEEYRTLCSHFDKYHRYDKILYQHAKDLYSSWNSKLLEPLVNNGTSEAVNSDKVLLVSEGISPGNKYILMNPEKYNEFKKTCDMKGITITRNDPVQSSSSNSIS